MPHLSRAATLISNLSTPTSSVLSSNSGGLQAYADGTTTATTTASYFYLHFFIVSSTQTTDYGVEGWEACDTAQQCVNATGYATGTSQTILTNVTGTGIVDTLQGNEVTLQFSTNGGCCGDYNYGGVVPKNFTTGPYYGAGGTGIAHVWGRQPSQIVSYTSGLYGCLTSDIASAANCFGGIQPSISMIFPTNGTTTRDFGAWLVNVSTTDLSTYQGTIEIVYENNATGETHQDFGQYASGVSTINTPVIKGTLLNPIVNLKATSTWTATPYYTWHDQTGGTQVVTGGTITFTIDPQSTSTQPSSTIGTISPFLPLSFASTSDQLASVCTPAADWTDVGGGIRYGICYGWNLIVTYGQNIAQGIIASAYGTIKGVFPFSVPLDLYADVQTNANALNATTTDPTISITMPYCVPSCTSTSSRTILLVSSSTKILYVGSQWDTLQQYLWDFLFIVIVFTTIRHERHT